MSCYLLGLASFFPPFYDDRGRKNINPFCKLLKPWLAVIVLEQIHSSHFFLLEFILKEYGPSLTYVLSIPSEDASILPAAVDPPHSAPLFSGFPGGW